MRKQKVVWAFSAVLIFVLVVGIVYFLDVTKRNVSEVAGPEPVQEARPTPGSPKINVQDQQKAVEQSRETITLADVSGGSSSGTATRSFDGSNFLHTLSAQLPPPGSGLFYEGWLVSTDADPKVISSGRLGILQSGQYALVFNSSTNLFSNPQVVVTLESTDDGRPETHILEGSF
jgi:hypothetical protein